MSYYPLPPEILDLIADLLHDEPAALKECCVASKSWVPRTRKHLFAHVEFHTPNSVEVWKETFPDPSNSPARHTRSLSIRGFPVATAAGADIGGWIRTFNRVVHLRLECPYEEDHQVSLTPFHGLSPDIKSLYLTCTYPAAFDLVCSFPLLEDLEFDPFSHGSDAFEWDAPPTSPKLTGFLNLGVPWGVVVRQLLDFPNGLHFAKIMVWCFTVTDIKSITDLVSRCSATLKSFTVYYCFSGASTLLLRLFGTSSLPADVVTLDLSETTKLEDVEFRCSEPNVRSITMALQTAKFESLQRITILADATTFANPIEETICQEWQDLDRLLAQLWTSHSVCPKVTFKKIKGWGGFRDVPPSLLPELTRRGVVDVVEYGTTDNY